MHGVKRVKLSEETKRLRRQKDLHKIDHYRSLTKSVFDSRDNGALGEEELQLTTELLLLNPEFYTIWNYRRDIFVEVFKKESEEKICAYLNNELKFIMAQLQKFPKCYWIWNHRIWCLETHPKANWDYELAIVGKLLELDARNYHGWQYRRFVVASKDRPLQPSESTKLNLEEFEYTTKMINRNISNFSAWHNRTKLIPRLLQDAPNDLFSSSTNLLSHELNYLKHAMYTDPEDTSVWLYLRWLLTSEVFVDQIDKEFFLKLLKEQLSAVEELNDLEKDDNAVDNIWCLKTIVLIKTLIIEYSQTSANTVTYKQEIRQKLNVLVEIDPLRKNRYLHLLEQQS